jgi:hypothetical protein
MLANGVAGAFSIPLFVLSDLAQYQWHWSSPGLPAALWVLVFAVAQWAVLRTTIGNTGTWVPLTGAGLFIVGWVTIATLNALGGSATPPFGARTQQAIASAIVLASLIGVAQWRVLAGSNWRAQLFASVVWLLVGWLGSVVLIISWLIIGNGIGFNAHEASRLLPLLLFLGALAGTAYGVISGLALVGLLPRTRE